MPSTSLPQARLMAAAAHSPAVAQGAGVPPGVAQDFNQADQQTGILRQPIRREDVPAIVAKLRAGPVAPR